MEVVQKVFFNLLRPNYCQQDLLQRNINATVLHIWISAAKNTELRLELLHRFIIRLLKNYI
jgi:hypothetical protein